ncbi:MAG: hypothetical protein II306_06585 [Clostridia bacterium]|nr:hypothetical protein [Clostridia bacterium]
MNIFSKELLIDQHDWKIQNIAGNWYSGTQTKYNNRDFSNYIIVGSGGRYLLSEDGITWSVNQMPDTTTDLTDVASPFVTLDLICGNQLLARGSAGSNLWDYRVTTSGISWQHCLYVYPLNKYIATAGAYLAYATPPASGQTVTWTITNQTNVLGSSLKYIDHLGTLITTGSNAKISTSTNGTSWTEYQVGTDTSITWRDTTTDGTTVAMIGYKAPADGMIYLTTSTDLTSWTTPVMIASGAGVAFNPTSFEYKNGQWLACGRRTTSYTGGYSISSNLTNWQTDSMPVGNEWNKVIPANTGWILAGKDYIAFREY